MRTRESGQLSIALVGPGYPPQSGGVEVVLERLAGGLAKLGCHVEVLVHRRHGDAPSPPTTITTAGVVVRRFDSVTPSFRFPVAPGIAVFLRKYRNSFDIIHGHNYHALPGTIAALWSSNKFVYTGHYHGVGHTFAAKTLHSVYRPLGEWTFRRANAIICHTEDEASRVSRDTGIPFARIRVIYPGVDIGSLQSAVPYVCPYKTILVVARLEKYKQIHILIQSMTFLDPTTRLVIIGAGPQLTSLQRTATSLGLGDRVEFKGRMPEAELRRWQRTATVAVTLSRHEAFGLSLLEAIVAGTPIIATKISAHLEVARFGDPASIVLVDVDVAPFDLAQCIIDAMDFRHSIEAVQVPTWESFALDTLDVYKKVIAAQ